MLGSITGRQFNEWRAYEELEPFGEVRADYRAASIVQALLNTRVNRPRGKPAIELKDCVVRFGLDAETQPQSAEQAQRARAEIIRTMEMLTELYAPPEKKKATPRARLVNGNE